MCVCVYVVVVMVGTHERSGDLAEINTTKFAKMIGDSFPKTGFQSHGQQRIKEQTWYAQGFHYIANRENMRIHSLHRKADTKVMRFLTAIEEVAKVYSGEGHQGVLAG